MTLFGIDPRTPSASSSYKSVLGTRAIVWEAVGMDGSNSMGRCREWTGAIGVGNASNST